MRETYLMSRQEGKVHQGQDVKWNTNRSPVCCYFLLSVTMFKELSVYHVIPLVRTSWKAAENYDLAGSVIQKQQLLICITVINYIYVTLIRSTSLKTTFRSKGKYHCTFRRHNLQTIREKGLEHRGTLLLIQELQECVSFKQDRTPTVEYPR